MRYTVVIGLSGFRTGGISREWEDSQASSTKQIIWEVNGSGLPANTDTEKQKKLFSAEITYSLYIVGWLNVVMN